MTKRDKTRNFTQTEKDIYRLGYLSGEADTDKKLRARIEKYKRTIAKLGNYIKQSRMVASHFAEEIHRSGRLDHFLEMIEKE